MQTSNIIAFVLDDTPIMYEERRTRPDMIPIFETDKIDLSGLDVVRFKRVNGKRIPVYESVYLQWDEVETYDEVNDIYEWDIRPCSFRYLYQDIADDDDYKHQFNTDDYC